MSIYAASPASAQGELGGGEAPHELFVKPAPSGVEGSGGAGAPVPVRHAKDGEEGLISSQYDAEENDDPASRIAGFKATRAASQKRALNVVLAMFMATMVLGSGANTWLNLSTSAKTNSVLYSSAAGMEAAGSETNMSGVALSQLSNRTLTPTGHHFYWTSLGAQYWAMAGLFALPLPFEALAAEVRWMEVLRCQKLPSLAALLSLCWGPWGFSGMIWIGLAKYGLPSVLGTRMMWWHWAVVSRLQFAAAPSPKHVLLRRTTALEFLGLGGAFLLLLYYPAFDIYCIHTGQWDQKVVGRTGAVIMIILEWLLAILILNRYRRQVFAPPDSAQAQGVDRVNLYADTALSGSAVWGAHIVLHYLFLLPDMEHDRQLLSMTDKTIVFPLEAPLWSFTPYAIFFCFRRQIIDALAAPFRDKQRLHDGAFIAALLVSTDDAASSSTTMTEADLIADAADLMRRIPMTRITLQMLAASPRDANYDSAASFREGEGCDLGSCDYFISHSWSDDATHKYAQLMAVTLQFRRKHGRDPTMWLDKVCINQQEIARTLRCLPVFVQSCSKLLILAGDSYVNRLWCVWELYVHFAMAGLHASERTTIVDCRSSEKCDTQKPGAGPAEALCSFDVKDAHCFSPIDEDKLRGIVECESAETFNSAIQEAGDAIATLDKEFELREQFSEFDRNGDGRLSRSELMLAFGWADTDTTEEARAAHAAQIDDLLSIINTDGRFLVNGELSISEDEYRAWLARAGGC